MASLKEIKGRIGSVRNTLKITSAMKVVASTKLHRVQSAIENMLPYDQRFSSMLNNFLSSAEEIDSPFTKVREPERVAIITIASNSSLCGGYNSGVIKRTAKVLQEYSQIEKGNLFIYPIGRKVAQALAKNYPLIEDFETIGNDVNYQEAVKLADLLMTQYANKEIDRVELLYMHYKSASTQEMRRETLLPLQINADKRQEGETFASNYIVEPSLDEIIAKLIPQSIRLKLYTVLLDSNAAEHAARTVAMQQATDNAEDLLQELSLQYNKGRQQAITSELLDIIGGSMK